MSAQERRDDAGEVMKQRELDLQRIRDYKQFAQAVVTRLPTQGAGGPDQPARLALARDAVHLASSLEVAQSLDALIAHRKRVASHELSPPVREPFERVLSLIGEMAALQRRDTALRAGPDAPQELAQLHGEIRGVLEQLESGAGHFVAAAAEEWTPEGDGPARWLHVSEYAHALADFAGPYLAIVQENIRRHGAANASAAAEPAPVQAQAAVQPAEASGSGRKAGRSRRRSNAARAGSQPATPAAPSAAELRTAALGKADRVLQKHPALTTRAVADAHGDPRILAPVAETRENRQDPIRLASDMRSAVQTRFGKIADLRAARSGMDSLEGSPDADVRSRIAQLDDRIQALRQVSAGIRDIELEALKQHPLPDGDHVQRLLALGGIQSVGAPVRLPSDGDVGARGTLFELRIQAQPLADGTPAKPLFLHVHTRQLASAEECVALQFGALAAVHVKTAAQRRMGGKWASVQQSLDQLRVRVHRGAVQPSTWDTLKAMPGAPQHPH
jgi:hypothetical protein